MLAALTTLLAGASAAPAALLPPRSHHSHHALEPAAAELELDQLERVASRFEAIHARVDTAAEEGDALPALLGGDDALLAKLDAVSAKLEQLEGAYERAADAEREATPPTVAWPKLEQKKNAKAVKAAAKGAKQEAKVAKKVVALLTGKAADTERTERSSPAGQLVKRLAPIRKRINSDARLRHDHVRRAGRPLRRTRHRTRRAPFLSPER